MKPIDLGRPIRVAVIDDHRYWIEMLADTFAQPELAGQFTLIGWATRLDEVHLLAKKQPADVVLVDFSLPDGHGTDGVPILRHAWPRCRAVLFSDRDLDVITRAALGVEIDALLPKTASKAEVLEGMRRVAAGEVLITTELQRQLLKRAEGRIAPALHLARPLTPRERGVLEAYMWLGTTDRAAAALCITPATFRAHLAHVMQKLGVDSRMEAVALALWAGLIVPPEPLSTPAHAATSGASITPVAPFRLLLPSSGCNEEPGPVAPSGAALLHHRAVVRRPPANTVARWQEAERTAVAAHESRASAEEAMEAAARAADAAVGAARAAQAALQAASHAEEVASAGAAAAKIAG